MYSLQNHWEDWQNRVSWASAASVFNTPFTSTSIHTLFPILKFEATACSYLIQDIYTHTNKMYSTSSPKYIAKSALLRQQDTTLFPLNYQKLERKIWNVNENVKKQKVPRTIGRRANCPGCLRERVGPRVHSKIKYAHMTMKSYSWIILQRNSFQIHEKLYKNIYHSFSCGGGVGG